MRERESFRWHQGIMKDDVCLAEQAQGANGQQIG
jgi:hypothetical protein